MQNETYETKEVKTEVETKESKKLWRVTDARGNIRVTANLDEFKANYDMKGAKVEEV